MSDKSFYYLNGSFDSLNSFKEAVLTMQDDEFNSFLSNKDFSNWLEHSLGEVEIAEKVLNASSKEDVLSALNKEEAVEVEETLTEEVKEETKEVEESLENEKSPEVKEYSEEKESLADDSSEALIEEAKVDEKANNPPLKETAISKSESSIKGNERHSSSGVSYISTESPSTFVMKEFLFGALFGLLLGMILMAMLIRSGAYF